MAASGSAKAVIMALVANSIITVIKLIAYVFSGSGAMLAEAIHSAADVGNQALLFLGLKRSQREPTPRHHFGFGKARFFWALVSAAGIFFILWSGLLVMTFTQRLRRGLKQRIRAWAEERAQKRLAEGLFPQLERTCSEIELQRKRLEDLAGVTAELRERMASSSALGSQLNPAGEPILVSQAGTR